MIKVFIAANGDFCYSETRPNRRKIGQNETYKTRAGIRTNVRAKLKFWGGTSKSVQWPDGKVETISI